MAKITRSHREMKIIVLIFVFSFIIIINGCKSDGVRTFYCVSEDKCVTVWKTGNESVFILLGKHKSSKIPTDDYIKLKNMTNMADWYVDVIFTEDGNFLIDVENNIIVAYQSSSGLMKLFNDNKTLNDSLYTYFDGKYKRYKNEVEFISIDIKENFATDKTGKKIE